MSALQNMSVVQGVDQAAVLLNPLRIKLLERLAEPDSASGLARVLGIPRQKINYHLHELERAGFLEFVEERKKGNCMERVLRATARRYFISPEVLGALGTSAEEVQDRFSSTYLIAVAAETVREVAVLRERARLANKKLPTLTLQSEVRFATAAARDAFAAELVSELARLVNKYHDQESDGGRTFKFSLTSYPKITKTE